MNPRIVGTCIALVVFLVFMFDWSIQCKDCGREERGIVNILKWIFRECPCRDTDPDSR